MQHLSSCCFSVVIPMPGTFFYYNGSFSLKFQLFIRDVICLICFFDNETFCDKCPLWNVKYLHSFFKYSEINLLFTYLKFQINIYNLFPLLKKIIQTLLLNASVDKSVDCDSSLINKIKGLTMETSSIVMDHLALLLVQCMMHLFHKHPLLRFVLIPHAARNYSRRRGKA